MRAASLAVLVALVAPIVACEQPAPPAPPAPAVSDDPEIVQIQAPAAPPPPRNEVKDASDLDGIRQRGALRILVYGHGEDVLPRAGASMNEGEQIALALAEHLGLRAQLVTVERFADLIPALLEGRGDLIAARMSVTEARKEQIAFTRATTVVDELLVANAADPSPPAKAADLAGRTVTVRASSSYRESLDKLKSGEAKGVVIADADEARDTEQLLRDVAAGKIAYTVADSDLFAHVQSYTEGITPAFVLRPKREIAFGVRPDNPKLKTAADAWLIERTLAAHSREAQRIDLPAIQKRGSLRVLTRNNPVSYFLYKGTQRGFDYEFLRLFAKEHGLRVDVVVPPDASDLIPWLLEGRGDVIAAEMTVTPERSAQVAFSPPYLFVDEVLVQRKGEEPLTDLAQLRGRTIHVRRSSSYRSTLDALQATAGPFSIVDAPEDRETAQLIADVGAGRIPLTVADSTLAAVELAFRDDVQTTLRLKTGGRIALASRPADKDLAAALAAFVKAHVSLDADGRVKGSADYNMLKKQYFESRRRAAEAREDFKVSGRISPYDDLLKKHATAYGLDWRLMAAQAYQESRFDPEAKSWVGALGLFQVMPKTGQEMGFTNLKGPEEGIHAGVRYMAQLIDSFDKEIPFKHRVRFALAAYNAGRGHVEDARRLAAEMGLNPNKWFKNTELAMLRLQEHSVAKKTRHGYCRGEEPVRYVSEIQSRYDNYITIIPDPGTPRAGPAPTTSLPSPSPQP